jgi:hypothetical protein
MNESIERLIRNFRLRNIDVCYFDTLEDAAKRILNIVPESSTVGIGHSAALERMNITKALIKRGNIVYDKETAEDKQGCILLKKKALTADWYITGSNNENIYCK